VSDTNENTNNAAATRTRPRVTTILVPNRDTNLALAGAAIINDTAIGNSPTPDWSAV
jgi:hypothetical protein